MEFQYEKELQKNELKYADLTEDAQTGIDGIKDIKKALNMLEKSGKKPTAKTLRKVKAMDKWVCYEIYDIVNDTDKNEDEIPFEEEEVLEEIEGQVKDDMEEHAKESESNSKGLKVELEIQVLHEKGVKEIDIEDLKSEAPTCYDILFDTYDPEEENGIETSNYSLIESKENDKFNIKKT
jgi:hypothetical protein